MWVLVDGSLKRSSPKAFTFGSFQIKTRKLRNKKRLKVKCLFFSFKGPMKFVFDVLN